MAEIEKRKAPRGPSTAGASPCSDRSPTQCGSLSPDAVCSHYEEEIIGRQSGDTVYRDAIVGVQVNDTV